MTRDEAVVVGLAADQATTKWGPWDEPATVIANTYINAVAAANAVPFVLPVAACKAEDAIKNIDALVLIGGWDIDSSRYGQAPHPRVGPTNLERDDWEDRLLKAALDADLPVLAICRGMQMLNVHCCGTLIQHLPDVIGEEGHLAKLGQFSPTRVDLDPTSKLGRIYGASVTGACYHHQAVDKVGSGLSIVGRAGDGTVEAIEALEKTFVVGVQWHPEVTGDPKLFEALVNAVLDKRG